MPLKPPAGVGGAAPKRPGDDARVQGVQAAEVAVVAVEADAVGIDRVEVEVEAGAARARREDVPEKPGTKLTPTR